MDRELEATFIEALDAVEAGEPLEAVLERYPQRAGELRPLLETAAALSNVPVAYSADARKTSRDTFLSRGAELRRRRRPVIVPWWRRFALAFGSLAVLLLIAGGLLVGPAGAALPGDALYPLKLAAEDARLALAGSPARRDALRERIRRERVSEINALVALGREADVSCFGTVRAIEDGAWLLDDLRVEITAATEIEGQPRVGASAEGTCRVANGQVSAVTMRVQSVSDLLPQPGPSVTATMEPTGTATGTPESSATPTPTLATTPTPSPTETIAAPPPAAGQSGNGDDGIDDDGESDDDEDDGDDESGSDDGGNDGQVDDDEGNDDDNSGNGGDNDDGHNGDDDNGDDDDDTGNDDNSGSGGGDDDDEDGDDNAGDDDEDQDDNGGDDGHQDDEEGDDGEDDGSGDEDDDEEDNGD